LERDRPKIKEPFRLDFPKMFGDLLSFLRTFEHWQIVAMCMLPFVLIAVGLATASFVRKHDSQAKPTDTVLSTTQTAENERIAALNQAELVVQDRVKSIWTAKSALDAATRKRTVLHSTYDGKQLGPAMRNAVDAQYKVADEEVLAAEANLNGWRKTFDSVYETFQKYGGKVDYTSQLPH
jgi:hypothetical protein